MKLSDLLSTLKTNGVTVTIKDVGTTDDIVEVKLKGYSALDDELEKREVKYWSIDSSTHIIVFVGAVVAETQSEEPATTTEPESNEEPDTP